MVFRRHEPKLMAAWKVVNAWSVVHLAKRSAVKQSTHNLYLMGLNVEKKTHQCGFNSMGALTLHLMGSRNAAACGGNAANGHGREERRCQQAEVTKKNQKGQNDIFTQEKSARMMRN